jgi:hypothetical protein
MADSGAQVRVGGGLEGLQLMRMSLDGAQTDR